jgi:hypothetical protein
MTDREILLVVMKRLRKYAESKTPASPRFLSMEADWIERKMGEQEIERNTVSGLCAPFVPGDVPGNAVDLKPVYSEPGAIKPVDPKFECDCGAKEWGTEHRYWCQTNPRANHMHAWVRFNKFPGLMRCIHGACLAVWDDGQICPSFDAYLKCQAFLESCEKESKPDPLLERRAAEDKYLNWDWGY